MKTIEERAKDWGEYIAERTPYDVVGAKYSYLAGANAQKEIDDAELLKLKAKWEINHDMKSIKERAKEYSKDHWNELTAKEAYIAGAKDQQAIDEEVRLKKSDDMTEAEYDRETAFADWYLKNGKGTPTYSDAIEWARKQTIDNAKSAFNKACGWLSTYTWYNEVVEEFRKAMEE